MRTQTVSYVPLSELFSGFPNLNEIFEDSDYDASWGGNSYTLESPRKIMEHLSNVLAEEDHEIPAFEWPAFEERVKSLSPAVYVDLES